MRVAGIECGRNDRDGDDDRMNPRFIHLLTDLRWLAFRIFGVPSSLSLRGKPDGGDGWPPTGSWYCVFQHFGGPEPLPRRKAPIGSRCARLTRVLLERASGRFRFGRCGAGFRLAAWPLAPEGNLVGHFLVGPYSREPIPPRKVAADARASGIEDVASLEWAAGKVCVLGRARERSMIGWLDCSLGLLLERYGTLKEGMGGWLEDGSGYIPPVRMGDDSPAAMFDVWGWSFVGLPVLHVHAGVTHQWELIFLERGEVALEAGGRNIRLGTDEVVLIPPHTRYAPVPASARGGSGVQVIFGAHFPAMEGLALRPLSLSAHQRVLLGTVSRSLLADPKVPGASNVRLNLLHFLHDLVVPSAAATGRFSAPEMEDALVAGAKRFMERSAERRLSLHELAAHCRTNPLTLAHVFRSRVGVPPFRYHTRLRIEAAKRMLREEGLAVAQVAERLEYADAAPFSRIFTRLVGVSPAAYARRSRSARAAGSHRRDGSN